MAKTCPHCETENPSKATHCMKCGALLVDVEQLSEEEKLQRRLLESEKEKELLKAALEAQLKTKEEEKKKDHTQNKVVKEYVSPSQPPVKPGDGENKGKNKLKYIIGAGVSVVILILLLIIFIPKENGSNDNGKRAEQVQEYISMAEISARHNKLASMYDAWEYFQKADSLAGGTLDATWLLNMANDRFTESIENKDLDEAAGYLDLAHRIYEKKGVSVEDSLKLSTNEFYIKRYEKLSDLYLEQAESAQFLYSKFNDNQEYRLMKHSIDKALEFNPENEKAKMFKDKECKK